MLVLVLLLQFILLRFKQFALGRQCISRKGAKKKICRDRKVIHKAHKVFCTEKTKMINTCVLSLQV